MSDTDHPSIPVNIEDEMRRSYMDYAMSVIIGRALPDVRDGLKPAHRRVIYGMRLMGLASNRPSRKCAKIVGEVMGNYHPHGDASIYDTLVRMAQDFNMRYTLVAGQGNFGSVDGDPPAAMRYTEARLTALADALMADLDKATVDFVPNYDETTEEPTVLPAPYPNLLVNGSAGIAVGMATNIPPHKPPGGDRRDRVAHRACGRVTRSQGTHLVELGAWPRLPDRRIHRGPQRDCAGSSHGPWVDYGARADDHRADQKGRQGRDHRDRDPVSAQQGEAAREIAQLARDKVIEGISDLRDESDREGMRIVIELRRGEVPEVVLNNLHKHTSLQTSFGIIMLAIVAGGPASSPSSTSSSTSSSSGGRSCGDGPSLSYGRPRPERISSRGSKLRLTTSTPSSHWSEASRRRLRRALG